MFELDDLRAFVAVVEDGGFGAAGRRLGLSKSMVSRRVARLEAELGARLLSRTTRGVTATEAGLAFQVHAQRVLAELEAAREAVGQDGEALTGSLRVAAPLSFGLLHLAPLLAEFAAAHPKLTVETSYSDRKVDLVGERYDLAVRLSVLEDSSLIARKIAPIYGGLFASPGYLEKHGAPSDLADLARRDAVAQSGDAWRLQKDGKIVTVRPNARFRADNGQALVEAAVAGLGIAYLPTFLAGPEIEQGRLVGVLGEYNLSEAGLYVVRPPPREPAPRKVRALTDLLVERFGGEPYWDACQMHRRAAA
ncbi:MAG: LysR substrate-binding domain-containing protein [Phenylobacterium sp.]|uniref:LysR family transcriptional regulator n=1 Tax=Phenylobacterium sp. TaxID=1871053 RepID=UPI0039188F05